MWNQIGPAWDRGHLARSRGRSSILQESEAAQFGRDFLIERV
jgi:hypothetical protein